MKLLSKPFLLFAVLLCLQGCSPTLVTLAGGGIFASRDWLREKLWPQDILDKEKGIKQAEVKDELWCYKTLGAIDCYKEPQDFPPESLVGVTPSDKFPKSREEHFHAVAQTRETHKMASLEPQKLQNDLKKAEKPSKAPEKPLPKEEEKDKSEAEAKNKPLKLIPKQEP